MTGWNTSLLCCGVLWRFVAAFNDVVCRKSSAGGGGRGEGVVYALWVFFVCVCVVLCFVFEWFVCVLCLLLRDVQLCDVSVMFSDVQ